MGFLDSGGTQLHQLMAPTAFHQHHHAAATTNGHHHHHHQSQQQQSHHHNPHQMVHYQVSAAEFARPRAPAARSAPLATRGGGEALGLCDGVLIFVRYDRLCTWFYNGLLEILKGTVACPVGRIS